MSVWKKIPIPPAGVMPGGLVTKIGIAATSLLLAAMLLTYTFTGGGAQDAEIEVPEAADLGLQQRAQAAIEAEARRQAAQLRLQADAAERQLAQLQGEQESNAALLSAGIVPLPGQNPGGVLLPDDQPVPFGGQAPRTEAEAVLLETLRLEEMERRRRSLRTEPLVLSYRNAYPEAATAAGPAAVGALSQLLPDSLSGLLQAAQAAPQADLPGVTAENAVCDGRRLSRIAHRTQRSGTGRYRRSPRWRRAARPLPVWPLPLPSCSLKPKLPSPGCLPIRPVGTVFMKDRSWRLSWSHSSAATFPVRSSPTYRSLSIPRTVNGS